MALGHERLDVYRLAITYVAWVYGKAAALDVLVAGKVLDAAASQNRTTELDRMAAMLIRLGGRGYQLREEAPACDGNPNDPDPDSDSDLDETKHQQGGGGGAGYRRLTADVEYRRMFVF